MAQPTKIAFADYFSLGLDLRFHFIFPIPVQKTDEETPLFGFTPDVLDAVKALRRILRLPQHPWEIGEKRENVLAFRMSGATYQLFPVPLIGFPHLVFDTRTPLVCFVTNQNTHEAISTYRELIGFPTLHISTVKSSSSVHVSELGLGHLCALFQNVRDFHKCGGNTETIAALDSICLRHRSWKKKTLSFPEFHHFSVLPNELVLESFGFSFQGSSRLVGSDSRPYVEAINHSADAIIEQRKAVLSRREIRKPLPLTLIPSTQPLARRRTLSPAQGRPTT